MGTKTGVKLDQGKILAGLCFGDFARALEQVARVTTYGAKKYTPHGWLTVPEGFARYTDAMLRHYIAESKGELLDAESGMYHMAQLAWNAIARLDLMLREREKLEGSSEDGREKCEGCPAPATTSDSEGVPLCAACLRECVRANDKRKRRGFTPPTSPARPTRASFVRGSELHGLNTRGLASSNRPRRKRAR